MMGEERGGIGRELDENEDEDDDDVGQRDEGGSEIIRC